MRNVCLLGFGVEGQAAARFFLAHTNSSITAIDQRAANSALPAPFSDQPRLEWVSEREAKTTIDKADLILRSPGLPPTHDMVKLALDRFPDMTTPTGYWLQHHAPRHAITVTGTKGKSSTVSLLAFLLEVSGLGGEALGNIGRPPLDENLPSTSYPVLELSSYMMHDLPCGPYTHVITSLYREHTNWHGTETAYREAKLRPFRLTPPQKGFAPRDVISKENLPDTVKPIDQLVQLDGNTLTLPQGEGIELGRLNGRFQSPSECLALQTSCAVMLDFISSNELRDVIEKNLMTFQGLPHRQEIVPSEDKRIWVNDALATVPEAVIHAVARWQNRSITLILGGADRGQSFDQFAQTLADYGNVSPIIFGSVSPKLEKAFHDANIRFTARDTLETALTEAAAQTPKEGVVLFSPAAASEAPHRNYVDRAMIFKKAASVA